VAADQVPDFDDMHDIVVSEPVSWWPLAPGWYVLMLILALALIWLGVKYWRKWRAHQYRRDALLELKEISPRHLPALVKRVCLSAWPRDEVANLSGDAWLKFLDQSGNTTDFTQGAGKILLDLSYNPHSQITQNSPEYQQLLKLIQRWIQQSRTGLQPVDNLSTQP
jgi:hypothetical protein